MPRRLDEVSLETATWEDEDGLHEGPNPREQHEALAELDEHDAYAFGGIDPDRWSDEELRTRAMYGGDSTPRCGP